jgi:hypothetical protein
MSPQSARWKKTSFIKNPVRPPRCDRIDPFCQGDQSVVLTADEDAVRAEARAQAEALAQ